MSNNQKQTSVSRYAHQTGKKLLATTAMTALGLFGLSNGAQAADDWTGHKVIDNPQTSITYDLTTPNTTNITQNINRVKVNGDADIKAGWTVNVAQPSSKSQYIVFDVEDGKTLIEGNLNANGEIFVFDRDGVIFSDTSEVNVGSIIASSGTLVSTDAQLDEGRVIINSVSTDGNIRTNGTINVGITAGAGGLAGFVGPNQINNGAINATMGSVAMAAGETVTLDLYGDGLVEVAVDGQLSDGLLKNAGSITADGGKVVLSASVAKNVVDHVINTTGAINASSATVKGGKIILSGGSQGKVKIASDIRANGNSGQDAGSIEITGENVEITSTGDVRARSIWNGTATAGDIKIAADKGLAINGAVSAYGLGNTGSVLIERTTLGTIGVGSGAGDIQLNQLELARIDAGSMTIGGDNTTQINVNGVNSTTATITGAL